MGLGGKVRSQVQAAVPYLDHRGRRQPQRGCPCCSTGSGSTIPSTQWVCTPCTSLLRSMNVEQGAACRFLHGAGNGLPASLLPCQAGWTWVRLGSKGTNPWSSGLLATHDRNRTGVRKVIGDVGQGVLAAADRRKVTLPWPAAQHGK